MARKKYPSDHRRWFRVKEDILDSPRLQNCSADGFRFYIRLLAMLNRTKAKDGNISLSRAALNLCAGREQRRHSLRVASEGAEAGLYRMSTDGAQTLIEVPKWPEMQEFTPELLRSDSDEIPTTKTKTKTKTNKAEFYDGSGEEHGEYRLPKGHHDLSLEALNAMINKRPLGKDFTLHEIAVWYVWKRQLVMDDYVFPKTGKPIENFRSTARRWFGNSMFELEDVDKAMNWVRLINVHNRESELEANRDPVEEFTQEQVDEANARW